MLVDSHCHLDFPDFTDELDQIVARAESLGVGAMLTICTHLSRFDRVRKVAQAYDNVWCSVGVHPHEAAKPPLADTETLISLADDPKVIGLGETGLDFFYEHSPRQDQEDSFRAHIRAARVTGLPVIVHSRDADDDTIRILQDEHARGPFRGLIHCYSSGPELAHKALELGFYISISGIVTFKGATQLRETIKSIPADRILVETDAPYLAPIPMRGKRNEPAYTAHTAAKVAEVLSMDIDRFSAITTENFFNLFTKADASRVAQRV